DATREGDGSDGQRREQMHPRHITAGDVGRNVPAHGAEKTNGSGAGMMSSCLLHERSSWNQHFLLCFFTCPCVRSCSISTTRACFCRPAPSSTPSNLPRRGRSPTSSRPA